MMKIVVLGSTGMAGHMISLYLEEKGFQVYRVSRSESNSDRSRKIDVIDMKELVEYIDGIKSDVVINCVGLLQESCEMRPDLAVLINSYLPHYLENHYRDSETKIIHLSTDCVFSGTSGNYKVGDLPDGRTLYDRSKALGELENKKDLTFRMSIIGPDIDIEGTGLMNWFMKQTGTIRGFSNVIWNGITTLELSEAIVEAITQDLKGIYQLVPDEVTNKYQLLLLVQHFFEKSDVRITEDKVMGVNKSLVNERNDFNYHVKDYRGQLASLKQWLHEHRNLYPCYYNV